MYVSVLEPAVAVTSQQPAFGNVMAVAIYPAVASLASWIFRGAESPSSRRPVITRSTFAGFIHMVFTAAPAIYGWSQAQIVRSSLICHGPEPSADFVSFILVS